MFCKVCKKEHNVKSMVKLIKVNDNIMHANCYYCDKNDVFFLDDDKLSQTINNKFNDKITGMDKKRKSQ